MCVLLSILVCHCFSFGFALYKVFPFCNVSEWQDLLDLELMLCPSRTENASPFCVSFPFPTSRSLGIMYVALCYSAT